jgi:hypothetical protein
VYFISTNLRHTQTLFRKLYVTALRTLVARSHDNTNHLAVESEVDPKTGSRLPKISALPKAALEMLKNLGSSEWPIDGEVPQKIAEVNAVSGFKALHPVGYRLLARCTHPEKHSKTHFHQAPLLLIVNTLPY